MLSLRVFHITRIFITDLFGVSVIVLSHSLASQVFFHKLPNSAQWHLYKLPTLMDDLVLANGGTRDLEPKKRRLGSLETLDAYSLVYFCWFSPTETTDDTLVVMKEFKLACCSSSTGGCLPQQPCTMQPWKIWPVIWQTCFWCANESHFWGDMGWISKNFRWHHHTPHWLSSATLHGYGVLTSSCCCEIDFWDGSRASTNLPAFWSLVSIGRGSYISLLNKNI